MNIIDLENLLSAKTSKQKIIAELINYSSSQILASKKDLRLLFDSLGLNLKSNKYLPAASTFLVLLLWNPDKTISHIRKYGLFRASKLGFSDGAINNAIDIALSNVAFLQLKDEQLAYLNAIKTLLRVAPHAKKLKTSLIQRLSIQKKTLLKTLLFMVNEFIYESTLSELYDLGEGNLLTAEELAEAFSYILHLMQNEIRDGNQWIYTDASFYERLDNNYFALLVDAAKLRSVMEIEILVDGMPYSVRCQDDIVEVASLDERLDKSIRLGYIQAELQTSIKVDQIGSEYPEESAEFSIESIVDRAFEIGLGEQVTLISNPLPRYVFGMPLDNRFFAFLTDDGLFKNEYVSIIGAGIENFYQSEVQFHLVSDNVSVIDVMKIQRLFSFIYHTMKKKVEINHSDDDNKKKQLLINSMVPVIPKPKLKELLSYIVSESCAGAIIKELSLNKERKLTDIQYYPFIDIGEYYVIPPAFVFKSNLLRNMIVGNNPAKRLSGKEDPMQALVVKALEHAGFKVAPEIKSNKGGAIENDITCWRDGELFVFECKNAYHPCSNKELTNSYEHIKKAGEQLDLRKSFLQVQAQQLEFTKRCGWDVPFSKVVHTAIITANRLFHGYSVGIHPVRQAHELINVLTNGVIRRSDGHKLRFWEGETFQSRDLHSYLQGKSLIAMQMEQLENHNRDVKIGPLTLRQRSYFMDLKTTVDKAELHFPQSV